MSYEIFDKNGRLLMPDPEHWDQAKETVREAVTVHEVYCAAGHDLIDGEHLVNGLPGIRVRFFRPNGEYGMVVLSPTLGDFHKDVMSGALVEGERVNLYCPSCVDPLPIIAECGCSGHGRLQMLYLDTEGNPHNAIGICNVVGCKNSSLIKAGEVIRAARLGEW